MAMMTKAWIWALMRLRALAGDERGVSLVEYAVLIAFAVLVVFAAVRNFGDAFLDATNFVSKEINDAVNAT